MDKPRASEHLLVDGYNLIKASPLFRRRERISLQSGRQALQQALTGFARDTGARVTLFFDGDEGLGLVPAAAPRPVQVVFSSPPTTADDLIKEAVQRLHGAGRVRVVTSDREIRRFAERHHIRVTRADDFADELERRPRARPDDEGPPDPEELRHRRLDEDEVTAWERLFTEGRSTSKGDDG